ncbi:hypothetical protein [Flavobacterium sp.]|uniref:hypothetical protein n=1 Tax=Flavobacterium sp. TaxID=239 RepID=UPI00374D2209
MNKFLKIIGGIVIIYLILFSCIKLFSNKIKSELNAPSPGMDNIKLKMKIENNAKNMNTVLPKLIDSRTELTNVEYIFNVDKFVYNYKIIDILKEKISTEEITNLTSTLKKSQLETLKNNPNNSDYIKTRTNFEYNYKDKNNVLIFSFNISSNENK